MAREVLEKCRRAQDRDGVLLEPSPSIEDDDDDNDNEGMEVRLGFSPEVRLWSKPTLAGPSSSADVPVHGRQRPYSRRGRLPSRNLPP